MATVYNKDKQERFFRKVIIMTTRCYEDYCLSGNLSQAKIDETAAKVGVIFAAVAIVAVVAAVVYGSADLGYILTDYPYNPYLF